MKLPLTEPEIGQMAEKLGRMLLRLPVISGSAGHKWAKGTVEDYLRPIDLESEFLRDIFSRPIPEVLLKWYPRIKIPEGMLFTWADTEAVGGPGNKELAKAASELSRRGESPAEYS